MSKALSTKVGKKTSMSLSQLGWDAQFKVLGDAALPSTLTGD